MSSTSHQRNLNSLCAQILDKRPLFYCINKPLIELIVWQKVALKVGGCTHHLASKVDRCASGVGSARSTLFEELGFHYIGPVDGHNIDDLVTVLGNVKSAPAPGPVLVHVVTDKGRGYPYAERAADKYHGKTHQRNLISILDAFIPYISDVYKLGLVR